VHDKTILIADNSIINRMQMGGILASEYNILEADNGHDALDIMRERGEDGIERRLARFAYAGADRIRRPCRNE
jgi:CheY-like chemotaxis protein